MGARRPNSKEEMSHSNLAAIEKTNGVHLSQKNAGSLSPLHGIHYPENTFKTSSPTKKLEKKSWLLTLREVRVQLGKTGWWKQANR